MGRTSGKGLTSHLRLDAKDKNKVTKMKNRIVSSKKFKHINNKSKYKFKDDGIDVEYLEDENEFEDIKDVEYLDESDFEEIEEVEYLDDEHFEPKYDGNKLDSDDKDNIKHINEEYLVEYLDDENDCLDIKTDFDNDVVQTITILEEVSDGDDVTEKAAADTIDKQVKHVKRDPDFDESINTKKAEYNGRRIMGHNETKRFHVLREHFNIVALTDKDHRAELAERKKKYASCPYKCRICHRGYATLTAYTKHMEKHDPGRGEKVCRVCKYRFKKITLDHRRGHVYRYNCKQCTSSFNNKGMAMHHIKFHEGVTFTCQQCNKTHKTKSAYEAHMRILHATSHICPRCGLSYQSELGLKLHTIRVHNQERHEPPPDVRQLKCEECSIQFYNYDALDTHMRTYHKTHKLKSGRKKRILYEQDVKEESTDSCHVKSECSEPPPEHSKLQLEDNNTLLNHKDPVTTSQHKPLSKPAHKAHMHTRYATSQVCQRCGLSFLTTLGLKTHTIHIHKQNPECSEPPPENISLKCVDCEVQFYNLDALFTHLKHHKILKLTGKRKNGKYKKGEITCVVCSKVFKTNARMKRHYYRIHHTIKHKSVECETCGKVLRSRKSLYLHEQYFHREDGRYPCRECGLVMCNKQALYLHRKTHTAGTVDRPHTCRVCQLTFTSTSDVNRHVKEVHATERLYTCPVRGSLQV